MFKNLLNNLLFPIKNVSSIVMQTMFAQNTFSIILILNKIISSPDWVIILLCLRIIYLNELQFGWTISRTVSGLAILTMVLYIAWLCIIPNHYVSTFPFGTHHYINYGWACFSRSSISFRDINHFDVVRDWFPLLRAWQHRPYHGVGSESFPIVTSTSLLWIHHLSQENNVCSMSFPQLAYLGCSSLPKRLR